MVSTYFAIYIDDQNIADYDYQIVNSCIQLNIGDKIEIKTKKLTMRVEVFEIENIIDIWEVDSFERCYKCKPV